MNRRKNYYAGNIKLTIKQKGDKTHTQRPREIEKWKGREREKK